MVIDISLPAMLALVLVWEAGIEAYDHVSRQLSIVGLGKREDIPAACIS